MPDRPARKPNRLPGYDYSQNGAYFVTICTKNRAPLLWEGQVYQTEIVGAHSVRPDGPCPLSPDGQMVDSLILETPRHYPAVQVPIYAVMPNHIHLLLVIDRGEDGRTLCAPTISRVIKQFKEAATKRAGRPLWQKSFHDHVIRRKEDFQMIWNYIETNPQNWHDDCFYTE